MHISLIKLMILILNLEYTPDCSKNMHLNTIQQIPNIELLLIKSISKQIKNDR